MEAAVRNEALQELDVLMGEWKLTMTDAWFLDSREIKVEGAATIEWLQDAFVVMRWELFEESPAGASHIVFGRSDARDEYKALYHDERGVCRVFEMTLADGQWTLSREDPDFHQRFIGILEGDRIAGRWEASEDFGKTWRKDFDLIFERRPAS